MNVFQETNEQMRKATWVLNYIKTNNPLLFQMALDAWEDFNGKQATS
jgi:uncharacterized protein YpiB (UPF0302 family)